TPDPDLRFRGSEPEGLDQGLDLLAEVGRGVLEGGGGDDEAFGAAGQDEVVIEVDAALDRGVAGGALPQRGLDPVDLHPRPLPVGLGEPSGRAGDDVLSILAPELLEELAMELGVEVVAVRRGIAGPDLEVDDDAIGVLGPRADQLD